MNAVYGLLVLLLAVAAARAIEYIWKGCDRYIRRQRVGRALVRAVRRDLGLEGLSTTGRMRYRRAS